MFQAPTGLSYDPFIGSPVLVDSPHWENQPQKSPTQQTQVITIIITNPIILIITMIVIMITTMIVILIITMMVNYDRNHHHHNKYQLINVHHPPEPPEPDPLSFPTISSLAVEGSSS
jgi:hypothetical protein